MSQLHQSYLDLLAELSGSLDRLSQLARDKAAAIQADDLIALDEVLKQEQAMTLNLRGLELRRLKLVGQLGLENVPLAGLEDHCPPELAPRARSVSETLRESYTAYRSCADMARALLELGGPGRQLVDALHQLLRIFQQGAKPVVEPGGAVDKLIHGICEFIQFIIQFAQAVQIIVVLHRGGRIIEQLVDS